MKVGIVGSGLVGATAAYALVMKGVGSEIVLVDRNAERAAAEADDISHSVPFAHALRIEAGDYDALAGSKVVVLTAGVNQKPGETRLELLARNAAVFGEVVPRVLAAAPDAVLLVATNPVDVLTHFTARLAARQGVSSSRILGSGTTLDTARFRSLLGTYCGIDAHHVHGYVIGEHGDSEVLTWSLVTIGGMPLEAFCQAHGNPLTAEVHGQIDERVRRAAYHIIAGKGATYYGVGSALARIVEAVLKDQRALLTVCSSSAEVAGVRDVTLSLPFLVGGCGVRGSLPLPLDPDETKRLRHSAEVLREAIAHLP